jgi:hypothetical protein
LPVFCDSAATSCSALASIESAIRSSARLRSAGGGVAPALECLSGGGEGRVDLSLARDRRGGENLPGAGVDQLGAAVEGDIGVLPADEVA